MKTLLILLSSTLLASFALSSQRTTRSRLKPSAGHVTVAATAYDTIATAGDTTAFSFSGYEKLLRSTKESLFVTSHCDSTVDRLLLEIVYLDMKRRMLHSRTAVVDIELPSGETRKVDIPSWDAQKAFYYYRSPKPKRGHATPYKVSVRLAAALKRK